MVQGFVVVKERVLGMTKDFSSQSSLKWAAVSLWGQCIIVVFLNFVIFTRCRYMAFII